jgi:hypothetical protein
MERREEHRRRTIKGGRIVFNDGYSTIACLIRDLSEKGASLRVDSVVGIPDEFMLTFDDGSDPRRCVVKNRRGMLHVAFIDRQ